MLLLSIGGGFTIECVASPLLLYSKSYNYWQGRKIEKYLKGIEVHSEIYQIRREAGSKGEGGFINI